MEKEIQEQTVAFKFREKMKEGLLTDIEAVDAFVERFKELTAEINKVIIGQDKVVKDVLISIFSR